MRNTLPTSGPGSIIELAVEIYGRRGPTLALGLLFLLVLSGPLGCGGGAYSPPPPPPPTITVTVSPASATLTAGGTQQFNAQVTGTTNTAVTWTTTGNCGTVASSGLFTAANVASQCVGKVIATSQADTSKSGSADVTVNPPPAPHIDSALWTAGTVSSTSQLCYTTFDCLFRSFTLTGQNFIAGDVLHISGFGDLVLPPGWPFPTLITGQMSFDQNHFRTTFVDLSITRLTTGATSNTVRLALITIENVASRWGTKLLYQDSACGPTCQTVGREHLFDVSNLAVEQSSFNGGNRDMAVDPSTEVMAASTGIRALSLFPIANPVFGAAIYYPDATNPLPFLGVDARDSNVCGTQPLEDANGVPITGNLVCAPYTVIPGQNPVVGAVSAITTIGTTPTIVKLTTLGNQRAAVVLNAGAGTLAVAPMPLSSTAFVLNLAGFVRAKATSDPQKMLDGAWLAVIESDPPLTAVQVRIAVVVDRPGKQIFFADLINKTVSGPFALSGDPFRVVADNTHQAAIVAFTSVSDGTTRLARIIPDGTRVDINGSFNFLTGGLAADASFIYGCGNAATCQSIPLP